MEELDRWKINYNKLQEKNDELEEKHHLKKVGQALADSQTDMEKKQQTDEKLKDELIQENTEDLDPWKRKCKKLENENDDLGYKIDELEYDLEKTKQKLTDSQTEAQKAQNELDAQKKEYAQQTEKLKDDLIQEKLRSKVVAALLDSENTNEAFKAFQKMLYSDFMAFANEESSIADEAQVLLDLQAIEQELQLISAYPEFHTKCTVAVGGGFSAGKSQFISSLFEDKRFSLPSNIEPTTALPTFVLDGKQGQLIGVNREGAKVNLSEIDPQISEKLTHQFMDSFGFPLKSIMPYMFLPTPLAYKHLCFIDTPGYNPASGGQSSTKDDEKTALQYLQDADAIIWLVNGAINGTLPNSDLQFLSTIKYEKPDVPLYIVLNRADQRDKEDIKLILHEIKRVLDNAEIAYYGITAYSSSMREEYSFTNTKPVKSKLSRKARKLAKPANSETPATLHAFLKALNHAQPKLDKLIAKIYAIDEHYQRAIWREICIKQRYIDAIEDATFKLNADNYAEGRSRVYDCLEDISSQFSKENKKLKAHLTTLQKISTKFVDVITQIFNSGNGYNVKLITSLKRSVISARDIDTSDIEITEVWDTEKQLAKEFIDEARKISEKNAIPQAQMFKDIEQILMLEWVGQHLEDLQGEDKSWNLVIDLLKAYQEIINEDSSLTFNLFRSNLIEILPSE
ncbi:dynamin family protein [Actinobacillus delphinicola]|uniref:Dynamin family n=1 Tax=Actinobacillus delphinicola TaxID=51161 RepID=A0A448TVU8_9PAST|nr:dynamin family protein [Actinobacillus delphinicola]VEJ10068.1 Dynamin family [Actinobacillus delphinicola]